MQAKDIRVNVDYVAMTYAPRGRHMFTTPPDEVMQLTVLEVTDERREGCKIVRCRVATLPKNGYSLGAWREIAHGPAPRRTYRNRDVLDRRPELAVGDEVAVPTSRLIAPAARYPAMHAEHQRAKETVAMVSKRERARTQVLADALQARFDAAGIKATAAPAMIDDGGAHSVHTTIAQPLTLEQAEALLTGLGH